MALVSVLALSSCPLPIVVRCSTDGDCALGEVCRQGGCELQGGSGGGLAGTGGGSGGSGGGQAQCEFDWQCGAMRFCEGGACIAGGKIGDSCDFSTECGAVLCDLTLGVCASSCVFDSSCRPGYDCAPDTTCVPRCQGPVPAVALGRTCRESVECECGYCVDEGMRKRCHQPCRYDSDCDGGTGSCRDLGGKKACKLP